MKLKLKKKLRQGVRLSGNCCGGISASIPPPYKRGERKRAVCRQQFKEKIIKLIQQLNLI